MRRKVALALVCFFLIFQLEAQNKECGLNFALTPRKAIECNPRGGLSNFNLKIQKGSDLKVAYLGGSITAQDGWRVMSMNYFRQTYPESHFEEVNATVGGTGSLLGVFRLDHDVLRYAPDLLFVEFAVNDAQVSPAQIVKSMEGIVRKTWNQYPDCDICFVYTFTVDLTKELEAGNVTPAINAMEMVADHYNIPSVHLCLEAMELLKSGKMQMRPPAGIMTRVSGEELNQSGVPIAESDGIIYFSPDGVHPFTNTGHVLYMNALKRALIQLFKLSVKASVHHLGEPICSNNYQNAKLISMEKFSLGNSWEKAESELYEQFSHRLTSLWKAGPGTELHFRFKGKGCYGYDLKGPGAGLLEVVIDGKLSKIKRFDSYCSYYRLALLNIIDECDQETIHEVTIRVSTEEIDKSTILKSDNLQDYLNNPEKYQAQSWYIGGIVIVDGELVN